MSPPAVRAWIVGVEEGLTKIEIVRMRKDREAEIEDHLFQRCVEGNVFRPEWADCRRQGQLRGDDGRNRRLPGGQVDAVRGEVSDAECPNTAVLDFPADGRHPR